MKTWFENDIQRLNDEIEDLKSLNVFYEIDEEAKREKLFRLRLRIEGDNPNFDLPNKTKPIELVAVFPDTYPYFRPNVYGYEINLARHQSPLDKGLCLLGRPTDLWDPNWTLAKFLQQQLAPVLVQGQKTDEKELAADPNEQAEPESEYFNPPHTVIFDPSTFDLPEKPEQVQFIGRTTIGFPTQVDDRIRAAVLQIKDVNGGVRSQVSEKIKNIFPETVQGLLYRIPKLEPISDAVKQFDWLVNKLNEQGKKIEFRSAGKQWKKDWIIKNVIGLNFPEEVAAGKKEMTGWIFLIVGLVYKPAVNNGRKVPHHFAAYAKASRLTVSDFQIRIPKLKPLAQKTVSIVGLGALGSVSAIELAKNGVQKIRMLDYDTIDAATTVRYPLGIPSVGLLKTEVIKKFIEENYPYTTVEIVNLKIGQYRGDGKTDPSEFGKFELGDITKFIDGTSLIYDASAEEGVTHYFSQWARSNNIPFVSVWGMPGAVGGQVLRVAPGKTEGCWMCYMWNVEDKKIARPPYEENGKIQSRGCGDISFTGASFDLQNISNAGVRMAVSILCQDHKGGYLELDCDIAVMALVDGDGKAILPQWTNYKLAKHPNCKYCNGEQ